MKQSIIWLFFLIFVISACDTQVASTPVPGTVHPDLKDIPIYPGTESLIYGSPRNNYQQAEHVVYSYIVYTSDSDNLVDFYEENMPASGWELLESGIYEVEKRKWESLLYFKSDKFVEITISQWTTSSYLIEIDLFSDSN